jgi:hypothetical protein
MDQGIVDTVTKSFRRHCTYGHREVRERVVELYSGKQVGRKVINTVPHDLGDPEEEPWIKVSIFAFLNSRQ